jgi:N-acetylglucosamine-6-phosphate deacetylase
VTEDRTGDRTGYAGYAGYTGRTVLAGGRLVLPGGVVEDGLLAVDRDRIAAVGPGAAPGAARKPLPPGALCLRGHTVVPGFVDLHVHGGGGASYASGLAEEALRAARAHLEHGTTTTMASTVTSEIDELCRQAAVLSELVEDGVLAGVHFEGPFLSARRCGAHRPGLLRDPDPAVVRTLLNAARGTARMVTLAPELPGGLESVRLLAERGVIASVGHTDADYDRTVAAVQAGATVATHLFNAMPAVHHRRPGPVVALLQDDRVTVELVNDGVHLHPAVVKAAVAAAGDSRIAFISDAMGAAGLGDGRYPLGPLEVRVEAGVARTVEGGAIAGSTLTLDAAFKRAITVGGLSLEQTVRALSGNPAALLGLSGTVGSLTAGCYADLVVLDGAYDLVAVMRRGRWVVGADRLTPARAV